MGIIMDDELMENPNGTEILDEATSKTKKELKKAHEREVRSKLYKRMEKQRLRNEFENIDGWF